MSTTKHVQIVCLCGSTTFKNQFIEANFRETMAGRIVLTVGWFSHSDLSAYYPTPDEKARLDELHKAKIRMADDVLVIDVCGYIGESTRGEIEEAHAHGKPVRYWSRDECAPPPVRTP